VEVAEAVLAVGLLVAGVHDLLGRPIAVVGYPDPASEEVVPEVLEVALIERVGELEAAFLLADGDLEELAQMLSTQDGADSLLDRLPADFAAAVAGLLPTPQAGLKIGQLAFGLTQVLVDSRLLAPGQVLRIV